MCSYISCDHVLDDANEIAQWSEEDVEAMEQVEDVEGLALAQEMCDIFENDFGSLALSPIPLNYPKSPISVCSQEACETKKASFTITPPQQLRVNVPPQKRHVHTIIPPQQLRVNNVFETDVIDSNSNNNVLLSSNTETRLPKRKRQKRSRASKYTREPLLGLVKEGIDRVRIHGHKLAVVANELDCDISARSLRRYVILSQDWTQPDSGFYFPLLAGEKPLKTGRVNRKRSRSEEQCLQQC